LLTVPFTKKERKRGEIGKKRNVGRGRLDRQGVFFLDRGKTSHPTLPGEEKRKGGEEYTDYQKERRASLLPPEAEKPPAPLP